MDFSVGRSSGLVFTSLEEFPQFVVIHTVKCFGVVNKAGVDFFFFELLHFQWSNWQWNLISGSSTFDKSSLNILNFTVHGLLKPNLENLSITFASALDECNCAVVWPFFGIAFLWDKNENWISQSCGHWWIFQISWHIECSTLPASSFRIWNSSAGISSPPLALFIEMLCKAPLTLSPGRLVPGELSHYCDYLGP